MGLSYQAGRVKVLKSWIADETSADIDIDVALKKGMVQFGRILMPKSANLANPDRVQNPVRVEGGDKSLLKMFALFFKVFFRNQALLP